jgi:hypothetical protein
MHIRDWIYSSIILNHGIALSFLTTALDAGLVQHHLPLFLAAWKETLHPLNIKLGGLQSFWTFRKRVKSLPQKANQNSSIFQPVA